MWERQVDFAIADNAMLVDKRKQLLVPGLYCLRDKHLVALQFNAGGGLDLGD
jgi:hypothetical protein